MAGRFVESENMKLEIHMRHNQTNEMNEKVLIITMDCFL